MVARLCLDPLRQIEFGREEGIRQQRAGYSKNIGWIHKWPYIVPNVVVAHRPTQGEWRMSIQ